MGASAVVEQGKFEKAPLEDILQMTFPVDPKMKDKVREQVAATTSQLPLSVNDAVLGYINYFSNRGHKTLLAGLQRSGRYRPMIQRILDEEGIPQESSTWRRRNPALSRAPFARRRRRHVAIPQVARQ